MLLIVITTIGSLALAAHGWPGNALAAWTVLGMALVSGGSSAINHWYDRDIDALMQRTSAPPGRQRARARPPPRSASGSCSRRPASRCWRSRCTGSRRLGRRRLRLLRARLHGLAQAPDAAEHRHRRRGGRGPAARRLGRRRRLGHAPRPSRCSRSSSSGRRPTSGRSRSCSTRTTRAPGVPMLPTVRGAQVERAADPRSTRCCWSWPRSCPSRSGRSAGSTRSAAALLGARFIWLAVRLLRAPGDRATARRTFLYSLLYLALLFAAMGIDSAL